MDYFYSQDAERHREVKLLKVTNSAELGFSPNRPLDSSAQQQCSSLHSLRKEELIPPTPTHPPRPSAPSISAGAPDSWALLPPRAPQPVLLLCEQRQELPGSLFSFLGYEHRFPTRPLPSSVPPGLLPALCSGQGGSWGPSTLPVICLAEGPSSHPTASHAEGTEWGRRWSGPHLSLSASVWGQIAREALLPVLWQWSESESCSGVSDSLQPYGL